jgi:hypothetical protein
MSERLHRWSAVLLFLLTIVLSTASAHAALQPCTTLAQRWVPCEINAPAAVSAVNPYTQMEVQALVTRPDLTTFTLRGYFAGPASNNFKLRLTPTTTGTWKYTVSSPTHPTAYTNTQVTITVGAAPAGKRGFLRRDANFLSRPIYDDGTHPFIFGNTYYQLVTNAFATGDTGGWKTAINNSINLYKMNKVRLLVYPWWETYGGTYAGFNGTTYYDTQPFTGQRPCMVYKPAGGTASPKLCPDYDQLSTAHFNALDKIVEQLFANGQIAELIIFKDPAGAPNGIEDNYRTFGQVAQDQRHVKYILARYGSYPNVIYSFANEWENAKIEEEIAVVHDEAYYNTSVGQLIRQFDPYYASGNNLRLVTIHGKTAVTPSNLFTKATSPTVGWMVHTSLQYGIRGPSPNSPDKWGSEIRSANGNNALVIDDEYGYLGELIFGPTNANARIDHRRAIWGLATSEVYGSIGDRRSSPNPSIRGDWVDAPNEYGDIRRMIEFFTATNRTPNVTNAFRMVRRTDVFNNATRRVWAMGQGNVQLVLYDAIGTANFAITLPAPPAGKSYKIWYYDPAVNPVNNAYTPYQNGALFGTGQTVPFSLTIQIPTGRAGVDTVYLIKSL